MYYIGVDLGGTNIAVGLVDSDYKIIESISGPTKSERNSEEILKDMAILCRQVMDKRNLTEKDIHSIGIGSPGIASPKEGIILFSNNLGFNHVNVRTEIQKYIPIDVYVENDANCAALGEVICGAAQGETCVVVVTLGTGIGGGLIIDGQIYSGSFFGAGEIGHTVIQLSDGHPCSCGRKGCWEQYASATALIRDAKEAAKKHPESKLVSMAKNKAIENINAKVVFDAAKAQDAAAQELLDNYFKYLACGITNLINILEPSAIVIGGGISAQKEYLTDPIKHYVQKEMYGGLKLKTSIKAATLGNDAGIIGAALLGTTIEQVEN